MALSDTVVDQEGRGPEIANLGPRRSLDFRKGHSHANPDARFRTPCHAILAFEDGTLLENGTFGNQRLDEGRYDTRILSQG